MSIHSSFSGSGGLTKHRSVLTRKERIERLKADGRFEEKASNLPKVRNIKLK